MKKSLFILTLLTFLPAALCSSGTQDDRRIEEAKREALRPTEARIPIQQETPKPMDSRDTIYLAELAFRKITYRYDICKAMVILKGVEHQYIDLDAQITFLKNEGLLPKKYQDEFDPMKPLRRGLTAYILRKALNVKGGVFPRLFKNSERYALSELVYQGIMASGNTNDIISGDELTSIITRAADHMAKHRKVNR